MRVSRLVQQLEDSLTIEYMARVLHARELGDLLTVTDTARTAWLSADGKEKQAFRCAAEAAWLVLELDRPQKEKTDDD